MAQRVTGSPDEPWSVDRLAGELRSYIGKLGHVWVEGEVTQWNESRGSVFGKLKDAATDATVSFSVWSTTLRGLKEPFARGDRVVALVQPDYWPKAGSISMTVAALKHVGLGELLAKLEQLRAALRAEGLFDADRKRPLPFLPHTIGLITGRDSDAEQDVVRNASLRWPGVQFKLAYAAVQGDQTVPTVITALRRLDTDPDVDVIIVARGGGDFQNLLGFSDERLLRAVAAATTPVVSAIGHEADRPLLDDVADLRASTPTDAAKRVVPDVADELARIGRARALMRSRVTARIQYEIERLAAIRSRPSLADPAGLVDVRHQDLVRLAKRADELVERAIERGETTVHRLAAQLRALSPQSTLDRGYAVVQRGDGAVVRDAADLDERAPLTITLARGVVEATASAVITPVDSGVVGGRQ